MQKVGKLEPKQFVELARKHGCAYDREKGGIVSKQGRPKGHLTTNGYKIVYIQDNGIDYYMCEQRVVWWWFHENDDAALVIDHLNSDRGDNRIENLEAVTQKENSRRMRERGRDNPARAERSGKTKLTNKEAMTIRYLAQKGMPRKDIIYFLHIDKKAKSPRQTVDRVIQGVRFGSVKDPADIWAVYPTIVAATARMDLPRDEQIKNALLGLAGEVGELLDIFKKHYYQGHPINNDELISEAGDILFYYTWLMVLCCGLDRAEIMLRNAAKLQERYPEGFSTERSLHRAEGDI